MHLKSSHLSSFFGLKEEEEEEEEEDDEQ